MANPSIQNGYVKLANELTEVLARSNIPGNEMRVLWVVLRKTWGWQDGRRRKDFDWISYSQFSNATGMSRSNCARAVKSLVVKKVLIRSGKLLGFNQNYDDWVYSNLNTSVLKSEYRSVLKSDNNKRKERNIYKRNRKTPKRDLGITHIKDTLKQNYNIP